MNCRGGRDELSALAAEIGPAVVARSAVALLEEILHAQLRERFGPEQGDAIHTRSLAQ